MYIVIPTATTKTTTTINLRDATKKFKRTLKQNTKKCSNTATKKKNRNKTNKNDDKAQTYRKLETALYSLRAEKSLTTAN